MKNKNIFIPLGANNHSNIVRHPHDYYATDPRAVKMLLQLEQFNSNIWECACGNGHISKVLADNGYNVYSSDLHDWNYGKTGVNFLDEKNTEWNGDIITNPPYSYAQEFVEKALFIVKDGNNIAMFLKLLFLEGKRRKTLFLNNPPKTIYVSSTRISCAMGGNFKKNENTAIAFAWYIWVKGFKGTTQLKWFN